MTTSTAIRRSIYCSVCGKQTVAAGTKRGLRTGHIFALRRCPACGFAAVEEPWTDYTAIYDEAYYRGKGSDPLVDYAGEYHSPRTTIRRYEWQGILKLVESILPPSGRWLDFGCGHGGLVRYVREHRSYDILGFDTGAWAETARRDGIPILTEPELVALNGTCDAITAIEVIEHIVDPLPTLARLRRLLKPGGVLFLTTGNLDHAPHNLTTWRYVQPEIHVSYFTPRALSLAFQASGLAPFRLADSSGWSQIIRFKILKNLRVKRANPCECLVPWRLLAPIIDRRFGISAMPAGRAI